MGKFEKGNKASPGRPKGSGKSVKLRELLEEHVPAAIEALVASLSDKDGRVVVQAAREILTRVYGVPVQAPPELPTDLDPPTMPVYSELRRTDPTPSEFPEDVH